MLCKQVLLFLFPLASLFSLSLEKNLQEENHNLVAAKSFQEKQHLRDFMTHPFEQFLTSFIPKVSYKATQLNKAYWLLQTTGKSDAADLVAELDAELRILLSNPEIYKNLLEWDQDPKIHDPILKRELNVLLRTFKQNQISKELLEMIAQKEAMLSQAYANFRPALDGKPLSDNEIREILKNEEDPSKRIAAWEASKEIGEVLAPKILELVDLRNQVAKSLGYTDYFSMQLALQEVDGEWLQKTLDDLAQRSDNAYMEMLGGIQKEQASRFHVAIEETGPWAWGDPFCQEDPLDVKELDALVQNVDLIESSREFYKKMGVDVDAILKRSDMYERPGKNQHAFCIHMDRSGDVRTLNNVQPSIKWLETILHELGHAIYELGFDPNLSWVLKEPPHMITTEAMALIAGRQAYRYDPLVGLVGHNKEKEPLMRKADESLRRRQLIFSRWVMVMTSFEKELYQNPNQDLNKLWWEKVALYQKIPVPEGREGKCDWAAKYHIGLAPVYYFSYLLGEMFASSIEEILEELQGSKELTTRKAGLFLQKKLFFPGNKMSWSDLVTHVTGRPLNGDAWLKQFAFDASVLDPSN